MYKPRLVYMQRVYNNLWLFLLAAAVAYVLYAVAIGAMHTWPNAEAINECALARWEGLWNYLKEMYFNRDGRYTTNFFHWFNPVTFGWVQGYQYMPFLGLLFFTGSVVFLFRTVFEGPLHAWLFAALFTAMHLALSPRISAEMFNMIGAFVYLYPLCFWMLCAGCLVRCLQAPATLASVWWYVWAVLFLVAMTGGVEISLVTGMVWLAALLLIGLQQRSLYRLWPLLLVFAAAAWLVVTNPGSRLEVNRNPGGLALFGWGQLAGFYRAHLAQALHYQFTGSGALLWPMLALAMLLPLRPQAQALFANGPRVLLWLVLPALAAAFLGSLPYYLFKADGPAYHPRIFINPMFFVQGALVAMALYAGTRLNLYRSARKPQLQLAAACWLLVALLVGNNKLNLLLDEYRQGIYTRFDNAMQQKHNMLAAKATRAGAGWQRVEVTIDSTEYYRSRIYLPVMNTPENPPRFYERAYERYYRLDEVVQQGDTFSKNDIVEKVFDEML